jgi:hypothetical protein
VTLLAAVGTFMFPLVMIKVSTHHAWSLREPLPMTSTKVKLLAMQVEPKVFLSLRIIITSSSDRNNALETNLSIIDLSLISNLPLSRTS